MALGRAQPVAVRRRYRGNRPLGMARDYGSQRREIAGRRFRRIEWPDNKSRRIWGCFNGHWPVLYRHSPVLPTAVSANTKLAVAMSASTDRIRFSVQGSAAEPYVIEFWREGSNLRSTCTCQAGVRGMACKHRLSFLSGDVTDLVSQNVGDLARLRDLSKGTDVEAALASYHDVPAAPDLEARILPLKPPGRRKSIPAEIASVALRDGGLAKGNTSYFDLYDAQLTYIGSVKVHRGTVLSESPSDYFAVGDLIGKRIVDALVWERSQSVYIASSQSAIGQYLSGDKRHADALRQLKRAVSD